MTEKSKIVAVSNASRRPRKSRPFPFGVAEPSGRIASNGDFWRWGDDNLFPLALSDMTYGSTTHRRIVNDKADYISGRGFLTGGDPLLDSLVARANGGGESLRSVINRLAFDKSLFGNAFLEIVTDEARSFLSLHHQDASRCRVGKDEKSIVMHHDWTRYRSSEAVRVPLYPNFETDANGFKRSMIHYKDYEPMFRHYGVPSYIAGLDVSTIAYKTDRWNISRLDSSFQLSGVMVLDGQLDDEQQAYKAMREAEKKFAGNPGQVMFVMKDNKGREDNSRFIPMTSNNEGDWQRLHDQAVADIIVAHSWFRSLSGLDYNAGFNSERILHEYEIALNTVILNEQQELLEPIRRVIDLVLGIDASVLGIVNRPPTSGKPLYMKVWEARRDIGLEYDPEDPEQQRFIGEITKYNLTSID